ncbi:hypothetical protein ACOSP7_005648 [Xanthoceras sorbifolium]
MESLREVLKHPAELYYLVKLKMALRGAEKHIPPEPHWAFCYTMVCVFYLVLRVLDTIEDDTSIPTAVKVPMLIDFYRHLNDIDWHYSFHQCSQNFEILIILRVMANGMASFQTVIILLKLCGSTFIFYQKRDIIEDYLEDINEIPKPRIFWLREIYSKYVDKIEDLKCEENLVKAVQCLNEMVTNALKYAGDCLNHLSTLNDDAALQFFGALAVKGMGTLVLCYNNIQVFKDKVKLRRGLAARLYEQTKTMSDIYNIFFEFAYVMKSKVEMHDPNAMKTLSELNKIQEICKKSGLLITSWINPASASAQIPECGRRGVVSLSLLGSMCDGCLNGCRATWVCEVWLFIESHDRLYLDRRTLIVGGSSCDHYHWAREAFQLSKNNSHLFYLLQKLKMALRGAEKHIPTEPHWAFCHTMVYKFLRNALIFQQFETKIRDAKRDMIEDYLEDINEIPKPRIFWPREIYSKYVDNIKLLIDQYALKHAGDCLNHLSTLNDDAALQFFGALATKTMSDIYNVFFEFASVMKSKVEMHDPNAMKTLSELNKIQEICRKSGLLNTRLIILVHLLLIHIHILKYLFCLTIFFMFPASPKTY